MIYFWNVDVDHVLTLTKISVRITNGHSWSIITPYLVENPKSSIICQNFLFLFFWGLLYFGTSCFVIIARECAQQLTRKTSALRNMMPGTDQQSCSIVERFRSRGTWNTKEWLLEENKEIRERMVRFEFAAWLNGWCQTWSNMERKIDLKYINVHSFSSWLSIYKYD